MPWTQEQFEEAKRRLDSGQVSPELAPKLAGKIREYVRSSIEGEDKGILSSPAKTGGFLDWDPSKGEAATPEESLPETFQTKQRTTPEATQQNFATSRATEGLSQEDKELSPSAVGSTASGLGAFKDLPSRWSPGGTFDRFRTKYVLEPSLEQYVQDMGMESGLPNAIQNMSSEEQERFKKTKPFQIYADRMWQKELEAAQTEGRPVVRQKFATGLDEALGSVMLHTGAFGLGAADVASAGIVTGGGGRVAEAVEGEDSSLGRRSQERIREEYPVSSFAGGVAGAFSPTGIPSLAARGIYGGAKKLLPGAAKSTVGRTALASGTGATVAGGESAVRDVAGGEEDPEVIAKRAALFASLGWPLAGAGHAVGEGFARSAVKTADRPGMRDVIYPADEAGIAFGPAMGVRTPGVAQKLRDRAIEAGHAAKVPEYAVSELEKPLAKAAGDLQAAERRGPERRLDLSRKLQRQGQFEPSNTGKALLDMLRKGTQESGKEVPFEKGLAEVRKQVTNLYSAVPATDESLNQVLRSRPNAVKLSAAEAERLGLGDLAEGQAYVVLSPNPQNPEGIDKIIDNIDSLANADALSRGGKLDPRYKQLMAEARKDRDLIPARPKNLPVEVDGKSLDMEYELGSGQRVRGYSALKADAEGVVRNSRERNVAVGLPGEIPAPAPRPVRQPGSDSTLPFDETATASPLSEDATKAASPAGRAKIPGKGQLRGEPIGEPVPKLLEEAGQWDRFRGKLLDYAKTGGTRASREALLDIAKSKPDQNLVRELGALRAVGLEEAANNLGTTGGLSTNLSSAGNANVSINPNIVNHAMYRSLPLRAALGGEEGYGGNLLTDIGQKLSPSLKGILRRMRGQGMPEAEARGRFGDSAMYRAKSPNLSRFALRGGRTGATALANDIPEAEEEAQLTPEDLQNLKLLIEATK